MVDQTYYDTVTKMENEGIDPEYMDGWMSGYLHNPIREEQRITEAYQAGFDDGQEKKTDNMGNFKK
jgi:hypothetical protein